MGDNEKAVSPEAAAAETPVPAEPAVELKSVTAEATHSEGVGRRKTSVARVRLKPGAGRMTINGRDPKEYFRRSRLTDEIARPFALTGTTGRFDMTAVISGSGLASQAGALRLAIARSLVAWQADWRPALTGEGLLTRDPRMVERKKYGIRGARRRPQWTKR